MQTLDNCGNWEVKVVTGWWGGSMLRTIQYHFHSNNIEQNSGPGRKSSF